MDLLRTLDDKVARGRAAVVTVDVQNDFCHEEGFLGKLGAPMHLIQAMVPRLAGFLDAARAHAVPVIHVISHHDEQYASPVVTEQKLRHGLPMELDGRALRDAPYCLQGTWGAELYGIDAAAGRGDRGQAPLQRIPQHEPRPPAAQPRHPDGFLTGVATNVCVESTGRDVYMHDYYLVFVSDGTATTSQAAHDTTLANIDQFFGQVATADAIAAAWAATGARPRAVAAVR